MPRQGMRQNILHHATGGEKLPRQALWADLVVTLREVIALEAELAHPNLRIGIVAAVGIQYAAASLAQNGLVGQQGKLRDGLQRSAHDAEGDDEAGGFDPGARPCVPHQAHALHALQLVEIHRSLWRTQLCANPEAASTAQSERSRVMVTKQRLWARLL